jgi:ATP-binding cassette, subfamily B, bacterial MsbA
MKELFSRLLQLIRPYRQRMVLGILCGVVAGLMSPMLMVAVKLAFNLIFPGEGTSLASEIKSPFLQSLARAAEQWLPQSGGSGRGMVFVAIAAIPAVMFVRGIATYLNSYFLNWAAMRAINDLRIRLFDHLHTLSQDFFNRTSTGELVSRIYNDTYQIHAALSGSISVVITKPVEIIALATFLISQQPRLTVISLTVLPLCIVPITIFSRKVRKSSEGVHAETAKLGDVMQEAFTASRVVKAYNLEATVGKQFRKATGRYFGYWMRTIRGLELPGPMIEFFGAVGISIIFLMISRETKAPMLAGDFISFVGSLFLLYQPIKQLSRMHAELQRARTASDRVYEMLALKPTVADPASPKPLHAGGADIVFDHVGFSYGEKSALEDFNLTIRAGQVVALVGQSGSGKTTVTNLLLRFIDPANGGVRIGGTDLREVSQNDLRSNIAIVTQEVVLFNESIRQNIAYGRPGATEADIRKAAELAHAHEFIVEKPEGYETIVGEKGVTLSGGQRQRIAIARAILRDAPILVLDEATSALDNEKERAVQVAFDELMKGRTTLVIAHRLSTIQNADLIVVMEQGRIVETGRHQELIRQGGYYQRLNALEFDA